MSSPRISVCWLVWVLVTSGWLLTATAATAQGPFVYQGEILVEQAKYQGELDFDFLLFDAELGGTQVGVTLAFASVEVRDGLFTVELDFGDVWGGAPLWLEIRVREAGDLGPFETLSPRKAITSSPSATFAPEASNADTVDGVEASDLEIQDVDLLGTTLRITEGTVNFDVDLESLVEDPDPTNATKSTMERT